MAQARVLADRLIPGEGLAWDAARVVAANLLMVACAYIAVPLPWTAVPLTMQTFGVAFIAVLMGARRGALVMALYLVEGAMGLPVFQPFGAPGALRLLGPTAGYLWAYPAAAFVTGWLVECCAGASVLRLGGALLAGQILIFAGGAAWLALGMGLGWSAAFWSGVAPFVLGDIVKMALVIAAVRGVEFAKWSR
ncbi:MAG: biotin transporter BioY [Candidatus Acidiferrales bacterium]